MEEDPLGNIWMVTSTNRIYVFRNNIFFEAPFSSDYQNRVGPFMATYAIDFSASNDIYLNSGLHTFVYDISERRLNQVETVDTSCWMAYQIDSKTSIPLNGHVFNRERFISEIPDSVSINLISDGKSKTVVLDYCEGDMLDYYNRVIQKDQFTIFQFGKKITVLEQNSVKETIRLDYRALSIYADKNGGLWVGTVAGLYHFPDLSDLSHKKFYLQGYTITSVIMDREENIWCSTFGKGILYLNHLYLESFTNAKELNKPLSLLQVMGSAVFAAGTGSQSITRIADTLTLFKIEEVTDTLETFRYIYPAKKGFYLFGKAACYTSLSGFGAWSSLPQTAEDIKYPLIEGFETEDSAMYAISLTKLVKFCAGKTETVAKLPHWGTCVEYTGNRQVMIGTTQGLFMLDLEKPTFKKTEGIHNRVNDIKQTRGGKIFIATKNEGLFEVKNEVAYRIDSFLGIEASSFFEIDEDENGNLWVTSKTGIHCLKMHSGVPAIYSFTTENGLPSGGAVKLAIHNGYIYFSNQDGLFRFSQKTAWTETAPKIHLREFYTKNTKYPLQQAPYEIPYDENSIGLNFDILTFDKLNKPAFFYELTGAENQADRVTGNVLELKNLVPGKYQLRINGVSSQGNTRDESLLIQFNITKPFYLTTWFYLLIFSGIILLLVFTIRFIIRKIRAKEEEKTRINKLIAESQLTALQAQMNPHFIFNAINSIQNFILKNNEKEAYDYLAKFSKLIRMVLNNSGEKTISLQQELETLKLYIELEQLRFADKFDYALTVSDEAEQTSIEIPAMLIQPYVENAIWHGLMNLNNSRKGLLKLDISIENDLVKLIIEDNGIGRAAAREFRKSEVYVPLAMKLTEKRVHVISQMGDYKGIRVEITDLTTENGQPSGTRVTLFLPLTN